MKCFHHNDIDGKAAGAIVARKTGNSIKPITLCMTIQHQFQQN